MRISNNTISFKKVGQFFYIATFSAIGLVWLYQNSLSLYWQQEFHKESPWTNLNSPLWLAGGKLIPAIDAEKSAFVTSIITDISTPSSQAKTSARVLEVSHQASAPVSQSVNAQTPLPVAPATTETTKKGIYLTQKGKVFMVGDSMMQGVAPHMMRSLLKNHHIHSINLSKQSTGLAYPGFFNWPKTIENTLKKEKNIELMVMFLGPNDPWDMPPAKGGQFLKFKSPEWEKLYTSRINHILELAKQHQVQVIWVAPPNMRKPKLSAGVNYLNNLYQTQVSADKQTFISVNKVFQYKDHAYSDYLTQNGERVKLRSDDGIHFTTKGQKLIAKAILDKIHFPEVKKPEQKSSEINHETHPDN